MVKQSSWNSHGLTVLVEQLWWNSHRGTVMVEQSKWSSYVGPGMEGEGMVEKSWLDSLGGTVKVE